MKHFFQIAVGHEQPVGMKSSNLFLPTRTDPHLNYNDNEENIEKTNPQKPAKNSHTVVGRHTFKLKIILTYS